MRGARARTLLLLAHSLTRALRSKCDNFFIEPHVPGTPFDELVEQRSAQPTFSVALGDFGESMVFSANDEKSAYTTQNRGTEYIRSPEMLAVANSRSVAHYDRRRKQVRRPLCAAPRPD